MMFGSNRYKIAKRQKMPSSKGCKKYSSSRKGTYIQNTRRSFK